MSNTTGSTNATPWRSLFLLLQASAVKRYDVQPHLQISKTIDFVKCCMETKDISRTPRWKKTHDASFGTEIRQNVCSPRPARNLKFRVRYFLELKSVWSPKRRFLCLCTCLGKSFRPRTV